MKRIFIILLALVLALSSCSPASTAQNSESTSSESSQSESTAEPEDIYLKKIAKSRKRVYEMLENCDDILDTIPNPAKTDTIPTGDIYVFEGTELPDCVVDWAYKYFSYMVTGNVYEGFDRRSRDGQILRFLTAMRRIDNEIVDKIRITAASYKTEEAAGELCATFAVVFYCTPYKYNESTKEYDLASKVVHDKLLVIFSLSKENGEWTIDDAKPVCGSYYDYANACKNKTWGRFPEVDEDDIFDYTICEYKEKLFNFGKFPLRVDL